LKFKIKLLWCLLVDWRIYSTEQHFTEHLNDCPLLDRSCLDLSLINNSGLKAYSSKNQYLLPRVKNSLQKTTIYFREFFVNLFELKKIQTVVDKNFESFRKEGEYLRLTEEVHAHVFVGGFRLLDGGWGGLGGGGARCS
jgi:hypothetical protein